MNRPRPQCALGVLLLTAALSACGSDDDAGGGGSGDGVLAGICPDTVVVQTDWYPESEHAEFYQLTGDGGQTDADGKSYTSPLYGPDGVDTGVDLEIRAGGPAIGFQQATAQMYADPDIMIAMSTMDQLIQTSGTLPTVGIVAPRKVSPQIIMWDPATYPDVESIADLRGSGATVLYFGGAAYMDYLTGAGILDAAQVDGSYDGGPSRFVSSEGAVAQQGYATAEPFQYENEIDEWDRPVAYQLIADTGFNTFPVDVVTPDTMDSRSECLTALVPMLQQAELDYLADPARVNELVSQLTEDYDGPEYSVAVADYAVQTQLDDGIVGNLPGTGFGGFDEDGVQTLIDLGSPIFADQGVDVAEDIAPDTIVTNQFIDPDIQLP